MRRKAAIYCIHVPVPEGGFRMKLVVYALGLVVASATVWAQAISTSQINGPVQDASGLAVPGAEVKATQTATGLVRTVMTGTDGRYVVTDVPVGPHQLEASKQAFSKDVQS